jgi:sugar phosphate isomerase/epimerase
MQKALGPGAIGVRNLPIPELIHLAAGTGFDVVQVDARELARRVVDEGRDDVLSLFEQVEVLPGFSSLPVTIRDAEEYKRDLEVLPEIVEIALSFGIDRFTGGMRPGSDEHPFEENFAIHVERLRPVAEILKVQGARLGLEFIAPKTFRAPFKYEFIHSLAGTLELIKAIGTGNVGILLDSWHLYTAHESVEDIRKLTAEDVVVVHVNDAPRGIPIDEQQDLVRALPMETGVIDIIGFMKELDGIGYDGPVMPEPFSRVVSDLAETDPFEATKIVAASMERLWDAAGLS